MNEWVKVGDRLPRYEHYQQESIANGFRCAGYKTSGRCLVVVNGRVTESNLLMRDDLTLPIWTMLKSEDVTHWMCMPEPPQSASKDAETIRALKSTSEQGGEK